MIKRLIFDVDNTLITGVNFKTAVEKTLSQLGLYSENNVENFINGISTYENIYSSYNYIDYKTHLEECMDVFLPNNFLEVFFDYLKYAIPEENEKLNSTIYELSKKYPEYGLEKHKGYGTKEHIDAIKKYGLTPLHRKSFCQKFV